MRRSLFLPIILLAVGGCAASDAVGPTTARVVDGPRAGLVVTNDVGLLAQRVTDGGNREIAVAPITDGSAAIVGGNELPFTLQREIAAPSVADTALPATHVVFDGTRAYVSYAPAGDQLIGAVDVFDISLASNPQLISSARFSNTKILTLAVASGRLYLGTASGDSAFANTPAVVEEITLDAQGRLTTTSRRVAVPSFVVTGIAIASGKVWVTSGTSAASPGGLSILDQTSLQLLSTETLADARAVSVNSTVITVLLGAPARLRLYNASNNAFVREVSLGGLSMAGHKATIANVANWAFIATGDSGVTFARIRQNGTTTGTKLLTWGSPQGLPGLDAALAVTNAVSVSGSYAYAANGGAGVWVARGNWSSTAQNLVPTITPVGRLDLPGVSSNMVGVSGGSLFVAAGLGGVKILQQPTP